MDIQGHCNLQLPHIASQIGHWRFDEQMRVILRQAVHVTASRKAGEHLPNYLEKEATICVIPRDGLTSVPA